MKQYAEALVECRYAHSVAGNGISLRANTPEDYKNTFGYIDVDPFADTLEGRRQADALEDWLHNEHYSLIQEAKVAEMLRKDNQNNDFTGQYNGRQKRLDRIKWCFEQLENKS